MSMFTLAISCLTASNLPWFMDLTFQIPMWNCSLLHWNLLPSTVTFTAECCFCFESVSLFFLELFPHWFPIAYWHVLTWGVSLSVFYVFAFSYYSWDSQGKNTEVVCHCLLQRTMFCQNFLPWPIHLGWSYMACLIVSFANKWIRSIANKVTNAIVQSLFQPFIQRMNLR